MILLGQRTVQRCGEVLQLAIGMMIIVTRKSISSVRNLVVCFIVFFFYGFSSRKDSKCLLLNKRGHLFIYMHILFKFDLFVHHLVTFVFVGKVSSKMSRKDISIDNLSTYRSDSIQRLGCLFTFGTSREGAYSRQGTYLGQGAYLSF